MSALAHEPGGVRRRRRRKSGFLTDNERGRRRRFIVIAVGLFLFLGFVGVPALSRLVESMMNYQDGPYNPRDFVRTTWVNKSNVADFFTGAEGVLTGIFLLLCVLFFMNSRRN
jgi:ABC-type sugar transport system permease subunit